MEYYVKVLFVSYPHVGLGRGGMYHQIKSSAESLEDLGCKVDIYNFMLEDISSYDVCHFFGASSINPRIVASFRDKGIPIVLSPVFNAFSKSQIRIKLENTLASLIPGFLSTQKMFNGNIQYIDKIIYLNQLEKNIYQKIYKDIDNKAAVIENGINFNIFSCEGTVKKNKNMVLNVGTICKRKNQMNLIDSVIGTGIDLHLVGPADGSVYARECIDKANSTQNITYHGELSFGSSQLKDLYSRASVFCLPSLSEVQPLTFIEASIFNCNILTGLNIPVHNAFKNNSYRCNEKNIQNLREKIKLVLKTDNIEFDINRLKSWENVATELLTLYKNL
jgi:glycosyltransferase involved in cell wall biosynthesis